MIRLTGMIALVWALGGSAALAQGTGAPADPCATSACRKAVKEVVIRVDDARYQTIPVAQSPYVLDATNLLIFPGETLAIQLTLDGEKIVSAKLLERMAPEMPAPVRANEGVAANPDDAALRKLPEGLTKEKLAGFPANVMLVSYGQQKGLPGSVLTLEHNLKGVMKVDAIIAIIGPKGYVQKPSSTCPISPGIALMEHWPDNLGPIILTKPRLLPEGADMACR